MGASHKQSGQEIYSDSQLRRHFSRQPITLLSILILAWKELNWRSPLTTGATTLFSTWSTRLPLL